MADNKMVLWVGKYDGVSPALEDLDTFEELHDEGMIGDYDAAVVDVEDGKPHIVKRVDHPKSEAIAEYFGHGALPRTELAQATAGLNEGEARLIVVGEPTIAKGFDNVTTKATKVAKQDFDKASDELSKTLNEALKSTN
jgi:hypothetical protein